MVKLVKDNDGKIQTSKEEFVNQEYPRAVFEIESAVGPRVLYLESVPAEALDRICPYGFEVDYETVHADARRNLRPSSEDAK